MYDKCMTKRNENRVVDIYNAVFVRSEADSNRCSSFCRAVPSHSAIRPFHSSAAKIEFFSILHNLPTRMSLILMFFLSLRLEEISDNDN